MYSCELHFPIFHLAHSLKVLSFWMVVMPKSSGLLVIVKGFY